MSAPNTNIEKQTSRHRPALIGIGAVAAFTALLFLGYLTILAERGTPANDESGAAAAAPDQ